MAVRYRSRGSIRFLQRCVRIDTPGSSGGWLAESGVQHVVIPRRSSPASPRWDRRRPHRRDQGREFPRQPHAAGHSLSHCFPAICVAILGRTSASEDSEEGRRLTRANGLVTSRTQSMKECTTGLSVRFFNVTTATWKGRVRKSTGNTLSENWSTLNRKTEPGNDATKWLLASKLRRW
jgi:hypothetical protein